MEMRCFCFLVLTWCMSHLSAASIQRPRVPAFMLHLLEESKPPADVVRSLRPHKVGLSQSNGARKEIQYLMFEVPRSAANEHLQEAQLRIYATVHRQHRGLYAGVERLLQITLRSPEDETSNKNIINIEATPTTLRHVYLKTNSWFTINITNSFNTWIKLNQNKLYIYIHVLNPYTSVGGSGVLQLIGQGLLGSEPMLLLMYDLDEPPQPPVPGTEHNVTRRSVHEVEDYEEETNNVWDDEAGKTEGPVVLGKIIASVASRKKPHRNTCHRKPLYIDFAEIEYDSWIVAPAGYEAYQCAGKCFYPVSDHLSPSKHAIVQTLLHTVSPRKVPRACCVPTKLQPISVLYVDQNGVLTYRFSYDDMVVAECGCR